MPEKYPKGLAEMVARLGPMEKALLYASEGPTEGFSPEQLRELQAGVERLAPRDEAPPHERRPEREVQVPLAVRRLRGARGSRARRDHLRVPQAGASL